MMKLTRHLKPLDASVAFGPCNKVAVSIG